MPSGPALKDEKACAQPCLECRRFDSRSPGEATPNLSMLRARRHASPPHHRSCRDVLRQSTFATGCCRGSWCVAKVGTSATFRDLVLAPVESAARRRENLGGGEAAATPGSRAPSCLVVHMHMLGGLRGHAAPLYRATAASSPISTPSPETAQGVDRQARQPSAFHFWDDGISSPAAGSPTRPLVYDTIARR